MDTKQSSFTLAGTVFLVSLASQSLVAGNIPLSAPNVVTFNIGPAWTSSGQTQTITLLPNVQNRYVASNDTHSLVDGELFAGWQKTINNWIQGQAGVAVMATDRTTVNGVIWQAADPVFDNETYNYKINHIHVGLKGKLIGYSLSPVQPYVSASLAVGFNHATQYTNTPVIDSVIASPNFTTNTQTAFSYTLGAGIQKSFSKNWAAGIGYEFADWGNSQLNRAPDQTLGNGLALNHLYTHGLQFNITYLI